VAYAEAVDVGYRRTTSILASIGLVALAGVAAGTGPASARSPLERVTLGGVNVISGDHIAGMSVHIPRPTSIEGDSFSNDDVSYSGRGRIVGLVLVEEDTRLSKAAELVSVRWSFCGKPGCRPRGDDVEEITSTSDWRGKRWEIPAGDYRLYLVADGAPVDVTLRLKGLEGRTSLRPTDLVGGRIAAPSATVPDPAGHLFLGRARPVTMHAPGLLIDGNTSGFTLGPSVTAQGSCFWRGRGEQDLIRSTPGPHCREFSERSGYALSRTTVGGGFAFWGLGHVPAGRWRSSYWSADVRAFPESDFLTLWLAYEGRA
jgi:hypothetical protein